MLISLCQLVKLGLREVLANMPSDEELTIRVTLFVLVL